MSTETLTADVHVFTIGLDVSPERAREYASVLSDDELARASRFRDSTDAARYISAHGALRQILGELSGNPPASMRFAALEHGKPTMIAACGTPDWQFNLSHSGGFALVAASSAVTLGVDIERKSLPKDHLRLAARFFSESEQAVYRDLPPESQVDGFFCIWTRKEAFIKAVGAGLAIPLPSFDVANPESGLGVPALRLRHSDHIAMADTDWQLLDLEAPAGYAAAMAARSRLPVKLLLHPVR